MAAAEEEAGLVAGAMVGALVGTAGVGETGVASPDEGAQVLSQTMHNSLVVTNLKGTGLRVADLKMLGAQVPPGAGVVEMVVEEAEAGVDPDPNQQHHHHRPQK